MKKNRSFIYIASAIIAMASCVSCGGGKSPDPEVDVEFSIQESSIISNNRLAVIHLDWDPSSDVIEFSNFDFMLDSQSDITSKVTPGVAGSRPLDLTIAFDSDLTTDDKGSLKFHYVDKTAKKEDDVEIKEIDVRLNSTITLSCGSISAGQTITFGSDAEEGEFEVDWGDETIDSEHSHTYNSDKNNFTVSITGRIPSFNLSNAEGILSNGNASISEIRIGEGVFSLPDYAFKGCSVSRTLVPASVTSMGKEVFPDSVVYCSAKSQPQTGWDIDWAKNVVNHDIVWDVTEMESNNDYFYAKTHDSVYIEKSKRKIFSGVIQVPERIGGLPVKVIGKSAFEDFNVLHGVELPKYLTTINDKAFMGCDMFTSVGFPSSLISIGSNAFNNCPALTTIDLPGSIVSIGSNAFANDGLKKVTMPTSLTSVGSNVFSNCNDLASIYCLDDEKPEGWAKNWVGNNHSNVFWGYIGEDTEDDYSFVKTTKGAYITKYEGGYQESPFQIPNELGDLPVINIGNGVFKDQSALISVTLPSSIEIIGNSAFSGCSNLTTITFPDTLKSIGVGAFEHCSKLTGVTLPNNIESISENAFSGCGGIGELIIPSSVSFIGGYAFDSCNAHIFCRSEIKPAEWSNAWSEARTVDLAKRNRIHWGYVSKKETTEYDYMELSNGCFSILKYKGTDVTEITIPDKLDGKSVIGIEDNAFFGDATLDIIHLTDSIQFISSYAFQSCGIKQLNIPKSVLSVGRAILQDVQPIIWQEVLYIYCEAKEDEVPEGWNDKWNEGIKATSLIYRWDSSEPREYDGYNYLIHSDGVEVVSYSGDYTYSFIVPSTIEEKPVTCIGSNVFNCSSAYTVAVPSQVTKMGSNAIVCYADTFVYCGPTSRPEGWASDWLGGSMSESEVIWGFDNPQTVGGVDYVRSSQEAHAIGCRGTITSLLISASYDGKPVTHIAPYSFYKCSTELSVSLPNTIKTIGRSAFYESGSASISMDLTSFAVGSDVPVCEGGVFNGADDIIIRISDASIKAALIANGWPEDVTYETP